MIPFYRLLLENGMLCLKPEEVLIALESFKRSFKRSFNVEPTRKPSYHFIVVIDTVKLIMFD